MDKPMSLDKNIEFLGLILFRCN